MTFVFKICTSGGKESTKLTFHTENNDVNSKYTRFSNHSTGDFFEKRKHILKVISVCLSDS